MALFYREAIIAWFSHIYFYFIVLSTWDFPVFVEPFLEKKITAAITYFDCKSLQVRAQSQ